VKSILLTMITVCSLLSFSTSAVEKGALSPDVMLSALAGDKTVNLSAQKGKLIYVDFWASWCVPCKKSFPFMNELHQRFGDQGLEIMAINMDENIADAEKFLSKYPAEFSLFKGTSEIAKTFNVPGLPVAYLIDENGIVIDKHIGFNDRKAKKVITQITTLLSQ
jgi:thiol-disulfide isomerase/thioredoxin